MSSSSTSEAYGGAPLSTLSPSLRGRVLEDIARLVDSEIHPAAVIADAIPGECVNGTRRGLARAEYDWSRDGLRIECKSAMMVWRPASKHWGFEFKGVKQAFDFYDELWLALYTPDRIHFYRHDGKFGLAKCGRSTICHGYRIALCGRRQVEDWTTALWTVMRKLADDGNGCSFLYSMPLTDSRISLALNRRHENMIPHVFLDAPLGLLRPCERATKIEALVRRVDSVLNPHSYISGPVPGYRANGHRRNVHQAEYDWCRDGARIECKSGQLKWDQCQRRWKVSFTSIKLTRTMTPRFFDELLLGFYTPRGIYVFKHNLQLGLSACGIATSAVGYQIQVYGARGEADWVSSLNAILSKLDASGCERIAFVQW